MNTKLRRIASISVPILLVVALAVVSLSQVFLTLAAPPEAPASAVRAATLPDSTCTYDGGTNTRTCEVWATTGSLNLPDGATVTIWGYASTVGGAPSLPGPALIAHQGETVQVVLHNDLADNTALVFPGQAMMPDLTGVAPGGTKTYSFTASNPGTYLYEAGLLPNAQHQVAMGLFGALVVRPAAAINQAYTDAATTFVDEELLVLSEIDPALNNSADPAAFDMRDYAPKYFLINGKAYPQTDEILSMAGNTILLRIVNAGIVQHSLGVLGMHQKVIAVDGSPLSYPYEVASATVGSGQTSDRLVTVPAEAGTVGDTRYALYDTSMLLHNNGAAGFGGMLTFITVTDGVPTDDIAGPTTSAMALAPNPADGSVDVSLSATVSDAATGGANIQAAEYFTNTAGVPGTGIQLVAADGAFDSPTEDVSVAISTASLANWPSGDHTIYVHGQDALGNWGAFNFSVLHLDKLGPATSDVSLAPNPSDGSAEVLITATGDDSATGNSDIAAAEYFIDATGINGDGLPLTTNVTAPIAGLEGSIDAATMGTLSEGEHTVYVHSMDAFGWWGDYVTTTLVVDVTGPTASDVTATPNPNNGALPYNPTRYAVRVDATLSDTASTLSRVEGFIDTVGTDGTGFPLTPGDGLFDELLEAAYAYIPLSTINQLAEGTHQIWVHGQDASGNWGTATATDLVIDKTSPTVSNVVADPNPTDGASTVALTANATDADAIIVKAEWYAGVDPGMSNGIPMAATDGAFDSMTEGLTASIDMSGFSAGDHTLYVRAQDAAGNWSAAQSVVLAVVPPDDIFADSFASGDLTTWNGGAVGPVSAAATAAIDGDGFGMEAVMAGITPGYVTDLTPAQEPSYHARFYFNANSALTGQNQAYTIFAGVDAVNTTIFRVQYRRQNQAGGTYQIRASALSGGAFTNTAWYTIDPTTPHWIEIDWASGANASFSLYIDSGTSVETLTGLDTSAYLLEAVHLGPSDGLTSNASGTLYFDAFVSRRQTVIGP
ncbi:MAG: multicopper oxidase domain-containing protein [Anaerolineae bacterium]